MYRDRLCLLIAVVVNYGTFVYCRNLNFILVTIGDNPLYGYYAALPYYDVAFKTAAQMYPNVFRNYTIQVFHKPGLQDCLDAASEMFVTTGEIFDLLQKTDGFSILMSPGCSPEMLALADFSREINVPLLASTSTDARFANRKRYPTFLTFGSTNQGSQAPATIAFLKYYKWKTLTLFCDDLVLHPPAAAFLGTYCRSLKPMLTGNAGYEFYLESYDSKTDPGYEARLLRAKSQSRVLVILTRADELRKIMLIAHKLNMTNSEYVYIYSIPNQGPDYIPLEVDMGSPDDQIVFEAYKHVIVITFVLPQYDRIQPYIDAVRRTAAKTYNYSYDYNEVHNEIILAIPEMIFSVAKALNESQIPTSELNVNGFLNLFFNRRFDIGDMRPVIIGPVGMRLCDTFYARLNSSSRKFEPAWHFNASTNKVSKLSSLADEWTGTFASPLNLPVCGYRNDRCSTDIDLTPIIVGAVCGLVAVSSVLIGVSIYCIKRSSGLDQSSWWKLDSNLLEIPNMSKPGDIGGGKYHAETVWIRFAPVTGVGEDDLGSNAAVQKHFTQMRVLRNEFIAHFHGTTFLDKTLCIVWEGGRGTLRSLYTNEAIISDSAIQTHLIFNTLTGLNYIHHKTSFHKHGSLSSLTVILDSRFTAKICDIATTKLLRIIAKKDIPLTDRDVVIAPEARRDPSSISSPEADVYSLGIIFFEILRGHVVVSEKELQLDGIKASSPFQIQIYRIIGQCCATDPKSRPNVKNMVNNLSKFQPRGNVVGSLLSRLETHAEHLEHTVAHRTEELLLERKKVDLLLAEIIPPSLVPALRNKIVVPAETYDCVTLYFSSMVGFDIYCKSKTPLEVGVFLNELYTFVDQQIASFDVYKVETIKDGYVVASGVPVRNGENHASEIASMALRVLQNCSPKNLRTYLPIRIGIHSGPIAAGFVGLLMPRFCLFGDTMNTASRMESHGESCMIHVSPETKQLLEGREQFSLVPRGLINVKGKGWIETYWLRPPDAEQQDI